MNKPNITAAIMAVAALSESRSGPVGNCYEFRNYTPHVVIRTGNGSPPRTGSAEYNPRKSQRKARKNRRRSFAEGNRRAFR